MNQKIKKFFSTILAFIVTGLTLPLRLARAAAWWDVGGNIAEGVFGGIVSIFLKVMGIFFLPSLFLSSIAAGITGLILGWIISPNFIRWKFTVNPFVDIGLSITQGFANMGFIVFLIVIALATALRIREYQAKKLLPTLIIVALLVNFTPIFCGIFIDASNIVMDYFLSGVTGINGFVQFLVSAGQGVWNLLIASGLDPWANVAALMQVIVMICFNFFAAFIFILFSALFIMRYIMLWILVILSPIAFVSYILPMTRRGGSLLNWRRWWKEFISWCTIGIVAAFFLYLGFTMISLINATLGTPGELVSQPGMDWQGEGLGLMDNILPYLIPLVLLWIVYRELKRTSAMFAQKIMSVPEKATKAIISAAAIAATSGAALAAGGAMKGAMRVMPRAMGRLGTSMQKFGAKRKSKVGGVISGVGGAISKTGETLSAPGEWAKGQARRVAERVEPITKPIKRGARAVKEKFESFAKEHQEFASMARGAAKWGLKLSGVEYAAKTFKKLPGDLRGALKKGFEDALKTFEKERGWTTKGLPPGKAKDLEALNVIIRRYEEDEEPTEEELEALPRGGPSRDHYERTDGKPPEEIVREEIEKLEKERDKPREERKKKREPPEAKKRPKVDTGQKKLEEWREEKPTEEEGPPGTGEARAAERKVPEVGEVEPQAKVTERRRKKRKVPEVGERKTDMKIKKEIKESENELEKRIKEVGELYQEIQSYTHEGTKRSFALGAILKQHGLPSSFRVSYKKGEKIEGPIDLKQFKRHISVRVNPDFYDKEIDKLFDTTISEKLRKELLEHFVTEIGKVKSDFEKKSSK